MTALPNLKPAALPAAIDTVTRIFNDACRFIDAHSQPLPTLGVSPNLTTLEAIGRSYRMPARPITTRRSDQRRTAPDSSTAARPLSIHSRTSADRIVCAPGTVRLAIQPDRCPVHDRAARAIASFHLASHANDFKTGSGRRSTRRDNQRPRLARPTRGLGPERRRARMRVIIARWQPHQGLVVRRLSRRDNHRHDVSAVTTRSSMSWRSCR
jgi:hypothetical protein